MVRLYCVFPISLIIIGLIVLSPSLHFPALAFHTASTANVTMGPQANRSEATTQQQESITLLDNNGSVPADVATEIYNHTNKALQALINGNTSEVQNQLNITKQKILLIISKNGSGQQSQELNATQSVATSKDIINTYASRDTAITLPEDTSIVDPNVSPSEDTATVETDPQDEIREAIENDLRERSEERTPRQ
jgi:hypothetical protein